MTDQEKYILVNLEDEKSKELASIISNSTARKILNYLADKDEISETNISKELNLPLSTVHYNLQQLKKNNLVQTKHFIYSEKGKKIELYSIVKKVIVIAPKYTRESLIKNILPLFLISAIISFIIQYLSNLKTQIPGSLEKAAYAPAMEITQKTLQVTQNHYGYWFLIGAWSILIIYLIIQYLNNKN